MLASLIWLMRSASRRGLSRSASLNAFSSRQNGRLADSRQASAQAACQPARSSFK